MLTYQQLGTTSRNQVHALFAQTMGYVALTAALFALGAWLGRDLAGGAGIIAYIAAFAALIGMRFRGAPVHAADRRAARSLRPADRPGHGTGCGVLRERGPAGAVGGGRGHRAVHRGFGAAGYATRRDLAVVARVCFWALVALIVFGIVLIFVNIPGGELAYSVPGLVIFAGFTMFVFQRLRSPQGEDLVSAPFLAASIFLDILNVFLFFLEILLRLEPGLSGRAGPGSSAPGCSLS